MKKFTIWVVPILSVVLIVAGINIQSSGNTSTTNGNSSQIEASQLVVSEDGKIISYNGQEGVTALELLKSKIQTTVESSAYGEYVSEINGIGGDSDTFWLYYVNDAPAQVGAAEYITQDTDVIEWRYE